VQYFGCNSCPYSFAKSDAVCLQFISDYNGEDHYFTRIGPGGLINLDKIYRTQAVMDRIASFHQHYHAQERELAHNLLRDQFKYASSLFNNYSVTFSLLIIYYTIYAFYSPGNVINHIQAFQFRIKDPRLRTHNAVEIVVCVFCMVVIFKLFFFHGLISVSVDIVLKLHIQKQNIRILSGVSIMRLCHTSLTPNTQRMCGNNNRNLPFTDLMSDTAQKIFQFQFSWSFFCESSVVFHIYIVSVACSFVLAFH
jgi:hypothetical protein